MIKLFRYLKPYWKPVMVVLLTTFIYAIIYIYLPKLMGEIVDNGIVRKNKQFILQSGLIMVGCTLFGVVFSSISAYFSTKVAAGFGKDLRRAVFTKVTNFSLNEMDKIEINSLITRTTNDVTQVQQVINSIFRTVIFAPMLCIGGFIMLSSEGANLAWVLWLAIMALVAYTVIALTHLLPIYEKVQVMVDGLNSILREGLMGIRVIRAFNRTGFQRRRLEEICELLSKTDLRANKIDATVLPFIAIIMNFTTLAVLWFGGIEIQKNTMHIGSVLAFMQYAIQIIASVIMVAVTFGYFPNAIASAKRINEVLDLKAEIMNPKNPLQVIEGKGDIEFRNVYFKYHGADEAALENISFSAKPGEITAIIGGTGSGKSTILNLITRFYDVSGGSILVDGIDIRKITQEALRNKISLVPQKSLLFSGTIAENIRYGKEDASDVEVESAAAVAQATEFICNMDQGFNSHITKGGANVSGGQRQRLAIARALVKQPDIYLFDDSFSALDFKTDRQLRAALKKEFIKKTIIIISQRISTVADADQIIILDEGRIVGLGKHWELLKNCPVYQEIVMSQKYEEEII